MKEEHKPLARDEERDLDTEVMQRSNLDFSAPPIMPVRDEAPPKSRSKLFLVMALLAAAVVILIVAMHKR